MTFFARPNLDNTQFKQLPDSTLSLSGVTQIQNVTGLTITDEFGTQVPIVVTGATNEYVLTYDISTANIRLKSPASVGAFNYSGASPTTCSVGGLSANTAIFGLPINDILQCILVPTLSPTLTAPSNTLSITPSTLIYEVGCSATICACATLNLGCIDPQYTAASDTRSSGATKYRFSSTYNPIPVDYSVSIGCLSYCNPMTFPITYGSNTICSSVGYAGGVQPKNSDGRNYCSPLSSGLTSTCTYIVNGVYPYFWGNTDVAPVLTGDTCAQCLISGSTSGCCIGYSTDDVYVSNYNVSGKYIWLAIPSTSTSKTKWQGSNSPSNCGVIPGDLFAAECIRNITSPLSCWGSTSYKFYVSNYGTSINYGMTFKNS